MNVEKYMRNYWFKKTGEPLEDFVEEIKKYFPKDEWAVDFTFSIITEQINTQELPLIKWENVDLNKGKLTVDSYDGQQKEIIVPKQMINLFKNADQNNSTPYSVLLKYEINSKIEVACLLLTGLDLLQVKNLEEILEKRAQNPEVSGNLAQSQTRLCLKAWNQKEVSATGSLTPCCILPHNIYHKNDYNNVEKGFSHIRQSLLDGRLNRLCAACYITPVVEKEELKRKIEATQKEHNQSNILASLPIDDLRIYTSDKCNLRCTYCTISNENYVGYHMSDDVFQYALEQAHNAKSNAKIYLNGHGEATFHPKWQEYFTKLLETKKRLFITTNLASKYTEGDYKILAKLEHIYVSLDSDDEDMMMKIRKKIRPQTVYDRIKKIQEVAKELNIAAPVIEMSIGVYNPSIWKMEEFMQKLITLNIQGVGFWQMKEVTADKTATSIIHLTEEQTKEARAIFYKSVQIVKKANLSVSIAPDLICSDGKSLYQEQVQSKESNQSTPSFLKWLLNKLAQ